MTDTTLDLDFRLPLDAGRVGAEVERVFRSLRAAGRDDAAWCVASAACALLGRDAPASAQVFYEAYRPTRPRRAEQPVDERAWFELLRHTDDDPYFTKLLECALPGLLRLRGRTLGHFGLREVDAVTPSRSSVAAVRALGTAAFALGVPAPWIFLRPHAPGAIAHVPSVPVAAVVGSSLLAGQSLETLAFLAGRHVAAYRSGYFTRVLCGDQVGDLTHVAAIALKVGVPSLSVTDETARSADELRAQLAPVRGALSSLTRAAELFSERGTAVEVTRWLRGAELTAWRAGLLVAGDLAAVRSVLMASPEVGADVRAVLFADLAAFSTSEAYFTLRRACGLALFDEPASSTLRAPSASALSWLDVGDARDALQSPLAALEPVEDEGPPVPRTAPPSVFPPVATALGALSMGLRAPRSPSAIARPAQRLGRDAGLAGDEGSVDELEVELVEGDLDATNEAATDEALGTRVDDESDVESDDESDVEFDVDLSEIEAATPSGGLDRSVVLVAPMPAGPLEAAAPALAKRGALDERGWESILRYTGADGATGELMYALAPHLRAARPRAPLDYGFDPRAVRDDHPLAEMIRHAAEALSTPTPLVFALEGHGALLARPPCDPPITVLDPQGARVFDGDTAAQRFLVAEHVAYFRRELVARVSASSVTLLTAVVRALAMHCVGERAEGGDDDDPFVLAAVEHALADADASRSYASWCGAIGGAQGAHAAVTAWCDAAECAALCAALVYAGELSAATRVLFRERGAPSSAPAQARVAMLEAFAHGPEFGALRT